MAISVIVPLPIGLQQTAVSFACTGDGSSVIVSLPLSNFNITGTPSAVVLDPNPAVTFPVGTYANVASTTISGPNLNVTFTTAPLNGALFTLGYHVTVPQVVPTTVVSGTVTSLQGNPPWITLPGVTNPVTLFYDAGAMTTTEGLITMGITLGGVAQAAATSYTVSAGKTLHLQSIIADVRSTSGSPNARVRLRTAASGISITSPIIGLWEFYPAGNGQLDRIVQDLGTYDIPSGSQIALSQIASVATPLLTMTLVGYES
jgi:hypothetical protein